MIAHGKIDSNDDIPDLCKGLFLTKDRFLSIIWVIAALMLTGGGGCIAWAMSTNSSIVKLQQTQLEEKIKVEYLQNEINKKLDILIKREENKNKTVGTVGVDTFVK